MGKAATSVSAGSNLTDLLPDTQLLNGGILYITKNRELVVLNDIAAQLVGQPQLLGKLGSLEDILQSDSEEYHILQHIAQTECEYRNTIIKWEVDGSVRHVLLDSFVHQSDNGEIHGMYVVMKDMGNFSALDQQTQREEKVVTIGKLAAGIAHEIRNPLTTVKGFLQVLEHRFQTEPMEEEIEYVRVMMQEIERVNGLVSEMLLLSKPQQLKLSKFVVQDLFADIYPLVLGLAHENQVQCSFESSGEVTLAADRDMIRQLLIHLIKNAIEAMDIGGCVNVTAEYHGDRAEIRISDTGPGIPYYLFDKIFDAFYTTKDKGTGLGLAICQRIVSNHGGGIRVSSKGFGTTFTVSLPIRRDSGIASF